MGFLKKVADAVNKGFISKNLAQIIHDFHLSYLQAAEQNGYSRENLEPLFNQYMALVCDQITNPYTFEFYHQRILSPFNYYQFGLDLLRPLVNLPKSKVLGLDHVDHMQSSLAQGENVILFSNHQIEPDPQVINILLQQTHASFVENMIFVAGHRVLTDPLAVPLSKGLNLLCIFSKNYIETPPEMKSAKLTHNRHTMHKMVELLQEGGKCIYVAPSGGRDRPDATGALQPAKFDPDSIEMFRLMAQRAGKTTHFHTLALATHDLQPPPNHIEIQLGENRQVHCTPIFLAFGPAIDTDHCVPNDLDKLEKRRIRGEYIWNQVNDDYNKLKDII